jgi:phosphoribosylformylglycinamidine synthase
MDPILTPNTRLRHRPDRGGRQARSTALSPPRAELLWAGILAREAKMKARVTITLREGVLDPQGEAIRQALGALGFDGVEGVRQGKLIEIDMAEADPEAARARLGAMCEALLANTVIETYSIALD